MLTPKQARFVEEYLIELCATRAASRAGYSKKNADKIGSQLLGKPHVRGAIDAAKVARSEKVGVDSDWVLQRLYAEVQADLADLFVPGTNDLRPVEEWPPVWREGLVQSVEMEALYKGEGKDRVLIGHVKKLRLSDRLRRLELIGKHVGVNAFRENHHHTGLEGLGVRLDRAAARLERSDK